MANETILVADDDPSSRLVLSHVLTSQGYNVLAAQDGREALTLFTDHADEISILITDCFMPEIVGIELAKIIRATFTRKIPIIMISSLEFSFTRETLHAAGVDHVLDKPFSPKAVCRLIQKILTESAYTPTAP